MAEIEKLKYVFKPCGEGFSFFSCWNRNLQQKWSRIKKRTTSKSLILTDFSFSDFKFQPEKLKSVTVCYFLETPRHIRDVYLWDIRAFWQTHIIAQNNGSKFLIKVHNSAVRAMMGSIHWYHFGPHLLCRGVSKK